MPIEAAKTDSTTTDNAGGADDGLPAAQPSKGGTGLMSDEELVAGIEAELEAGEKAEAEAAAKAPAKDEKKPPDKAKDEKPAEKEIEVKLDERASKSIEATNRYRAQVERQLQQREEALGKREAEIAPRLAKAEAYEKAVASRDPLVVAEALGYGTDDLEQLAHAIYKMSKSASPADRAAAAQALRARQTGSEVQRLEQQIQELTKSIQQRDQEAQRQAFVQQYTSTLSGAVDAAEHTLVANALKNAPREAQRELLQLAARMEQSARGVTPEPIEVIKQYEQTLRRQAQALGFDPTQVGKQNTQTTPTPDNNGQKKTTAGLTQDLGPQTRSRSAPKSRDEAFDEVTRDIEEMDRKNRRA